MAMEDIGWMSNDARTTLQIEAAAVLQRFAQRARDIAARIIDGRFHSTQSSGGYERHGWRGVVRVHQMGSTIIFTSTHNGEGCYILFILRQDGSFGILCAPSTNGVPNEHWREVVQQTLSFEQDDTNAGRDWPNARLSCGHPRSVWFKPGPDGWCHGRIRMEDIAIIGLWLDDTLIPEKSPHEVKDLKPLRVKAE